MSRGLLLEVETVRQVAVDQWIEITRMQLNGEQVVVEFVGESVVEGESVIVGVVVVVGVGT